MAAPATPLRSPGDSSRARREMVQRQIAARGIRNEGVLEAMRVVPRETFVDPELEEFAYEDSALPIAEGQTISQPYRAGRWSGLPRSAARSLHRRIPPTPDRRKFRAAPRAWPRAHPRCGYRAPRSAAAPSLGGHGLSPRATAMALPAQPWL